MNPVVLPLSTSLQPQRAPFPPLTCNATQWKQLGSFINEALANATHQPAGLLGASLEISVLLSRRLLPVKTDALRMLSDELKQRGIIHSFSYMAEGGNEPLMHQIRIAVFGILF